MRRRSLVSAWGGATLPFLTAGGAPAEDGGAGPRPTPAQQRWQDCEVGLIYHFDLPLASGNLRPNNNVRARCNPALYNPVRLDTDQWLEAATAAGARYAIFTATHFNGFMQWQSDLYPYGVKQARWRDGKGDVVADFVASCHKVGIAPGLYLSTHRNVYWTVWGHYVGWGKGNGTAEQEAFNRVAEGMTEELCSRYGPLLQIWFDAGVKTPDEGGPDVLPLSARHQPDSMFYSSIERSDHRWIGNEDGYADYPCWATMPGRPGEVSHNHASWQPILGAGDADGQVWSPGMVDVPLRGAKGVHDWFWTPGKDHAVYSVDALTKMYRRSVGHNCNLVLGEVITPEGLVPQGDIDRLAEFGREIRRRFGSPVASTEGEGGIVELALPGPATIDHVIIMEAIAQGERVRDYLVEGLVPGNTWQELCRGHSVGHKRIQRFDRTEVAAVRLRVTRATATPLIQQLAVYAVG